MGSVLIPGDRQMDMTKLIGDVFVNMQMCLKIADNMHNKYGKTKSLWSFWTSHSLKNGKQIIIHVKQTTPYKS